MLLEVLLFVTVLLFFIYKKTCTIPPGLPPGFFGWPVLGYLPSKSKPISEYFEMMRQKYGKIFTTKWGSLVIVVMSDLQFIKKAFAHPDLQGRPELYTLQIMNDNRNAGVLFAEGNQWVVARRWALRMLRDLGMGKSALDASIQDEAAMLVKHLERQDLDKPVAMDWCINVAVLNVIWQMLAGLRYEAGDKEIVKFTAMLDENLSIAQGPMFVLDLFPWLLPIIPGIIYNKVLKCNKFAENCSNLRLLYQKIILEHAEKLDRNNPQDLIDFYLLEIKKEMDNPDTIFKADYSDLVILMNDMFAAGTETTSNTLRWMILYMAMYPQVQEKVHAELDREVPKDRLPSLDDRPRLPYVDATILDVLRLSSLVTNGIQHSATADVQLEGYTIPKGTVLFANLEYFHHHPALWKKPTELYPEHFLDSEGKLDSKKEAFVPFSIGRRQCLGESLARMELFLFTAAILQRFEITTPPGVTLDQKADPINFFLRAPKPFNVMLKKR